MTTASSLSKPPPYRRVKTGCGTCRIRKLKCDEARPACNRCVSTGRKCDGYLLAAAATIPCSARARRPWLAPQPTSTALAKTSPLPAIPRDALQLSSEQSIAYGYFHDRTASSITGGFVSPIWDRLVFQFCHHEPAVLHAVVAVGAMHQHIFERCIGSASSPAHDQGAFAIAQYLRSLQLLRRRIERDPESNLIETTLVICVLFICFEMLQGNNRGIMTHLETGLRILTSQVYNKRSIFQQNAYVSCLNELCSTFSRLDIDTVPFAERSLDGALLPPHIDPVPALSRPDWVRAIPRLFLSFTEARTYLDALTNATYHFSSEMLSAGTDTGTENGAAADTDFAIQRCRQSCLLGQALPDHLQSQLSCLKGGLARWSSAFRALVNVQTRNSSHRRAQLILELRFFTVRFQVHTCGERYQMLCDRFNASFRRVVAQAEELLGDQRAGFAIESGILPALYTTAMKCREPQVRNKAATLLRSHIFQEGMWSSLVLGYFVAKVVELEESSAIFQPAKSCKDITEHGRFHAVIVAGTSNPHIGRIVCGRFRHEGDGELEIREYRLPLS